MTATISVTQTDIERYRRSKWTKKGIAEEAYDPAGQCPISYAASRQLKSTVRVGEKGIRVNGHDYPLPVEAQSFVDRVDAGLYVQPFTFILDSELGAK